MRGTLARKARKAIYGEDGSPRHREYKFIGGTRKKITRLKRNGYGEVQRDAKGKVIKETFTAANQILTAGVLRQDYQELKKEFKAPNERL